ncbi:unnamed protein product [Polarella glacialis]|uniref:Uncharacterized protein n=1 Tax=Polarella glacialis TaxID=89957 RepID=A0A813G5B2_POLGL|nr:unnamed protein product [Polarella glacialis]
MDSSGAPLTARRLSWADQEAAAPLASTIPQGLSRQDGSADEDEDDVDEEERPGERTVEMGILRQGYTYRVLVLLPSVGQLVEVVGPWPEGVLVSVEDEGSPERPASLWFETELKQVGSFHESVQVRLAAGEFEEVTVHLQAIVMGPREGRPSRVHEHVELIKAFTGEDVASTSEGARFRKLSNQKDLDDEDR